MATQTMPVEVMLLLQPHGQATIHRIFASVPPHQPIWRFLFAHQFRKVKKPGTHFIAQVCYARLTSPFPHGSRDLRPERYMANPLADAQEGPQLLRVYPYSPYSPYIF